MIDEFKDAKETLDELDEEFVDAKETEAKPDDEFVDAKETLDEPDDVLKNTSGKLDDDKGELSDQETVVEDSEDEIERESSDLETLVDDEDIEYIPEDVTMDDLYLIRTALEETNRIKKIEAAKKAMSKLGDELKRSLTSKETDEKLDKYVDFYLAKKETEKNDNIEGYRDNKFEMDKLANGMSLNVTFDHLYKQEMEDYSKKYDRIWNKWTDIYWKIDKKSHSKDMTKALKFIEVNRLSLPKDEGLIKRSLRLLKNSYKRYEHIHPTLRKIRRAIINILVSPIDNFMYVKNKLFKKDMQEIEIERALNDVNNRLNKDEKSTLLMEQKKNLLKLKFKYKIFKNELTRVEDKTVLAKVLNEDVTYNLKQVQQNIKEIKKEGENIKLAKISPKQIKVSNNITKSIREDEFASKKTIPQEKHKKTQGREFP